MPFDLNPIDNRRDFLRKVRDGASKVALGLAVPSPLALIGTELGKATISSVVPRAQQDHAFVQRVRMVSRIKKELEASHNLNEANLGERQILYFANKVCKLIYNPSLSEAQARRSLRGVISFLTGSINSLGTENQRLLESYKEDLEPYRDRFEALSYKFLELSENSDHDFIKNKKNHLDEFNDFSKEVWFLMWSLAWNYDLDLEKAKKDLEIFVNQYCLAGELAEPVVAHKADEQQANLQALFKR